MLGFHPPLTTCESTADAPMLHRPPNLSDMWDHCISAPCTEKSIFVCRPLNWNACENFNFRDPAAAAVPRPDPVAVAVGATVAAAGELDGDDGFDGGRLDSDDGCGSGGWVRRRRDDSDNAGSGGG
uniref:Uncharacterized protein n=1 Tax=Oryza sativa subsp. japonica TaxID=39947 RepID=Q6ZFS4_ORYSJ|nr:hypothetical protein [Oryza sativa Japonica Group]